MWRDKVKLEDGETLKHERSSSKGFMSEEEVDEYSVLNIDGTIVGRVVHSDHTAVKGFRRTQTVRQTDADGRVLIDVRWTGD